MVIFFYSEQAENKQKTKQQLESRGSDQTNEPFPNIVFFWVSRAFFAVARVCVCINSPKKKFAVYSIFIFF